MINERIIALQQKLVERGLDGVIYGPSANMQYLLKNTDFYWQRTPNTGFYVLKDSPLCSNELSYFNCRPDVVLWVPVEGEAAVVATYERAQSMPTVPIDVVCYYVMMGDYIAPFIGSARKIGVGLGCQHALQEMLAEISGDIDTVLAEDLVEQLRMIKDADEIAALRKVAEFTDFCMGEIVKILKPGITQWEVECRLNALGYEHGCPDIPFTPSCTYTQPNPNRFEEFPRVAKDIPLAPGMAIAFDNGFVMDGYCSDFGRSFYCGKVPQKVADAYKALQAAQVELLEKIKPGMPINFTFEFLYHTLEKWGYQDNLSNYANIGMMGHQIGISVHEEPWLHNNSTEVFKPGMVMCIEPKIRIPGEAFMRVEDMVLITENGCESLTKFDRDMYQLPVD